MAQEFSKANDFMTNKERIELDKLLTLCKDKNMVEYDDEEEWMHHYDSIIRQIEETITAMLNKKS